MKMATDHRLFVLIATIQLGLLVMTIGGQQQTSLFFEFSAFNVSVTSDDVADSISLRIYADPSQNTSDAMLLVFLTRDDGNAINDIILGSKFIDARQYLDQGFLSIINVTLSYGVEIKSGEIQLRPRPPAIESADLLNSATDPARNVDLRWIPNASADNYTVRWIRSGGEMKENVTERAGYDLTNLEPGYVYNISVYAQAGGLTSGASTIQYVTAPMQPLNYTLFRSLEAPTNSVSISWEPSLFGSAESYRITWDPANRKGQSYKTVSFRSDSLVYIENVTDLTPGTEYRFRVKALVQDKESPFVEQFITMQPPDIVIVNTTAETLPAQVLIVVSQQTGFIENINITWRDTKYGNFTGEVSYSVNQPVTLPASGLNYNLSSTPFSKGVAGNTNQYQIGLEPATVRAVTSSRLEQSLNWQVDRFGHIDTFQLVFDSTFNTFTITISQTVDNLVTANDMFSEVFPVVLIPGGLYNVSGNALSQGMSGQTAVVQVIKEPAGTVLVNYAFRDQSFTWNLNKSDHPSDIAYVDAFIINMVNTDDHDAEPIPERNFSLTRLTRSGEQWTHELADDELIIPGYRYRVSLQTMANSLRAEATSFAIVKVPDVPVNTSILYSTPSAMTISFDAQNGYIDTVLIAITGDDGYRNESLTYSLMSRTAGPYNAEFTLNGLDLTPGNTYQVRVKYTSRDMTSGSWSEMSAGYRLAAGNIGESSVTILPPSTLLVKWSGAKGRVDTYRIVFVSSYPSWYTRTVIEWVRVSREEYQRRLSGLEPGRTYWIQVYAVAGDHFTAPDIWTLVATLPHAAIDGTNINIVQNFDQPTTSLVVTWQTPSVPPHAYEVSINEKGVNAMLNNTRLAPSTDRLNRVIFSQLQPGTQYIVRVDTIGRLANQSEFIVPGLNISGDTWPSTPLDVLVFENDTEPGEIVVTWQYSRNITHRTYVTFSPEIPPCTGAGCEVPESITNITEETEVRVQGTPGLTYLVSVSAQSNFVPGEAVYKRIALKRAPLNRLLLSTKGDDLEASWDSGPTSTHLYYINWTSAFGDVGEILTGGKQNQYNIQSINRGDRYDVTIQAVSNGILGHVHVNRSIIRPDEPEIVSFTQISASDAQVIWRLPRGRADSVILQCASIITELKEIVVNYTGVVTNQYHSTIFRNLSVAVLYKVRVWASSFREDGPSAESGTLLMRDITRQPFLWAGTPSSTSVTFTIPSLPPPSTASPVSMEQISMLNVRINAIEQAKCAQEIVFIACDKCTNTSNLFPPGLRSDCEPRVVHTVPPNQQSEYEVNGLLPDMKYEARVLLTVDKYAIPFQTAIAAAPNMTSVPTLEATAVGTLKICWEPPVPRPGPTNYNVTLKQYPPLYVDGVATISRSWIIKGYWNRCFTVTHQIAYWPHIAEVFAETDVGESALVVSPIVYTLEEPPEALPEFTVDNLVDDGNFGQVRLNWNELPTEHQHANITHLIVHYNRTAADGTVSRHVTRIEKTNSTRTDLPVIPDSEYSYKIYAVGAHGSIGAPAYFNISTEQGPAPRRPDTAAPVVTLVPGRSTTSSFLVSLDTEFFTNQRHGEIIDYGLLLVAKDKVDGSPRRSNYKLLRKWSTAKGNDFELYRATPIDFTLKRGGESALYGSTVTYEIGRETCDNREYEYCNGKLGHSTEYSVIGFACTVKGCTETPIYSGFFTERESDFTSLEVALIILVCIFGALCIVLIIVIIAMVCCRKNRRGGMKLKHGAQNNDPDDEL